LKYIHILPRRETSRLLPAIDEKRISNVDDLCAHTSVLAGLVTTGADNLGLIADSLAVGAAIFFFVGWNAVAGGICAFFGGGHTLPSSVPS
jgi:hypothetical protein